MSKKRTPATARLSVADALTMTVPETIAPPAGAVMLTIGGTVSAVAVTFTMPTAVCPAASRISYGSTSVPAKPGATVVNITGDYGFQFCMEEWGMACQYNIPIVVVVVNNGNMSLIRQNQKYVYGGLRYAIENGFDVVNMSLSTTKRELAESLHELADLAYFQRTMLVASAHNLPVESYPWRFASVLSVGSHDRPEPLDFFYNPEPPVEFFARGVDVEVAWLEGSTLRCTGNSFATPHMSGICALVLGAHPELTPFQLKSVLYLTSSNPIGSR